MYDYDVKAVHTHTSAVLLTGRHRIRGLVFTHDTGVSGDIVLHDNATAAAGTVLIEVDETTQGTNDVVIPGRGILAKSGVYATLPANTTLTVFYE